MEGRVLQIDQLSIALLLAILVILALVKYRQHGDQPLLHPLILARQAEASQVHPPKESATYRSINAPLGFDLAMRPQRATPDVASLLKLGVTGTEGNHARRVLDASLSNAELRRQATEFAYGLQLLMGVSSPVLVLYGYLTSARAVTALLAGAVSGLPISTYVVPDGAQVDQFPSQVDSSRMVVVKLHTQSPMPVALQNAALQVVLDGSESSESPLPKSKVVLFDDVLGASTENEPGQCDYTESRSGELDAIGAMTFATFYDTASRAWLRTTNTAMTSGVTAWLSAYPPEKIPGMHDTIVTDAYLADELPTPAYITLLLTALYTGAAFASEGTSEMLTLSRILKPSLLYVSAYAAFQMEFALWLPATGALLNNLMYRANMYALRNGRFPRSSLLNRFIAAPLRRKLGLDSVRACNILSNGTTIDQATLDQLRLYLACPVMHTYVPMYLVQGQSVAAVTSPVASTHMYDLQAFAPQLVDGPTVRHIAPHVGPPAVTMELKLVQDTPSVQRHKAVLERLAQDSSGHGDDPVGEVFVRGYALAQSNREDISRDAKMSDWYATGDVAYFRTNGTLVLVAAADSEQAGVKPDLTLDPNGGELPRIGQNSAHSTTVNTATLSTPSRMLSVTSTALATLAMLSLCVVPTSVQAQSEKFPSTPLYSFQDATALSQVSSSWLRHSELQRRSSSTIVASQNATMYNLAISSLLMAQRASWEQGVTQSAILETYYPQWSVFQKSSDTTYPSQQASQSGIPNQYLSLAYHSIAGQDRNGRLATTITGDEALTQGASQDSASCGEGVLIGSWIIEGFQNNQPDSNGYWGGAVTRELDYLMRDVSRSSNGVLSQRAARGDIQIWSDQTYMGPPFFATYGLMTNNATLFEYAFDQIGGIRNALLLRQGPGKGLWGHIMNYTNIYVPHWIDERAWLTGNAWAAAGLLRVMAAAQHSSNQTVQQKGQGLSANVEEILNAAFPFIDQNSGLFHNVVNDTSTFLDGSGSALMGYAVFRLGSMVPSSRTHIDMAEKTYQTLQKSLDPYGTYTNGILTVNELSSGSPGATSTESLAFLALLASARRDYYAGNVTGSNGSVTPPAGSQQSVTSSQKSGTGVLMHTEQVYVVACAVLAAAAFLSL
ncbi:hypothetical protein MPSI1_001263 [Malassezia psittaci]|uniref:Uncharacterized protein n=1 Tax=Malassezia psittaci TaxID=1821823 RepID=A0AAF0F8J3_9BASI|nr:hypothetical protein MPSI1_001263 [Malassezia psittaci]